MTYIQIIDNKCIRFMDTKEDDCYEIGRDVIWKIDVKRNNNTITISPNEMNSNEEIIRTYDELSKIILYEEENGIKTIRYKTEEELLNEQKEKMSMLELYKNDYITKDQFLFHMLGIFVDTMRSILLKIEDENINKKILNDLLMWTSDNEEKLQEKITEKYTNKLFEFGQSFPIVQNMTKQNLIEYYKKDFKKSLKSLSENNFMG
jgi:hypothetical protein